MNRYSIDDYCDTYGEDRADIMRTWYEVDTEEEEEDTKEMYIVYQDEIGMVEVCVDMDGVQFMDGVAHFCDGNKDYKVPTSAIVEISTR